jgi:hypothetical protein
MSMKSMLKAAMFGLALGATTLAAQAAPGAPVAAMKDAAPAATTNVEQVAVVRRCWWSHGRRYCRLVRTYHRPVPLYTPRYRYRYYRSW